MLKGLMEILLEQNIKNEIWKTDDILYYSKGITDEDYAVLKFTGTDGRYYCNLKSKGFKIGGEVKLWNIENLIINML